jgi:replicative DNA helicase
MTNELTLIKLLLNKESYNKYNEYVDVKHLKDNIKELYYLYITMKELHEVIPSNISIDEFSSYFYSKYPDNDKTTYAALFEQLAALDVSDAAASAILDLVSAKQAALRLSEASFSFAQGFSTIEQVRSAAELLLKESVSVADETEYVTTDLDELLSDVITTSGLRWRLDCLNKSLGSLRKGDFGFIFARPETGKTTFLASEISYMFDQTDAPILWFNNEEQGSKVMLRLYQAYFGCTLQQLMTNAANYKRAWKERVGDKFRLVDSAAISKSQVEKTLSSYGSIGLILFDQIDKIKGFEADRKDLAMGAIYQWARELAKSYAPTIGVCQADGTGEGQKWLTMQNVADAKTAKQAEADWIAGIGKTHNQNEENVRYINLSKNKLTGDSDTIPELRHGRFETLIQPEIARYKDIVSYE